MKNSKQTLFMIIALILVYAVIWYFFLRKEKVKEISTESSFRGGGGFHGGGMGRRGGFFHGGRGSWGGWGYPYGYGYQYPYYDEEPLVIVNSTKCPKGWIWMGAMLGCQKPQGV